MYILEVFLVVDYLLFFSAIIIHTSRFCQQKKIIFFWKIFSLPFCLPNLITRKLCELSNNYTTHTYKQFFGKKFRHNSRAKASFSKNYTCMMMFACETTYSIFTKFLRSIFAINKYAFWNRFLFFDDGDWWLA